jgi:hypothetical protein
MKFATRFFLAAVLVAGCGKSPMDPGGFDSFGPGCTVSCRDRGPALREAPVSADLPSVPGR